MLTIDNLYKNRNGGLRNIGSTCYVNTLIQCLSVCDKFILFLLNNIEKYKERLLTNKKESNYLIIELMSIYKSLVIDGNSLIPKRFIKCLSIKFNYINIYSQNDIHEILLMIINRLNEEINYKENEIKFHFNKLLLDSKKELLENDNENDNENYNIMKEICLKQWYNLHKKEYSEIIDLFYGHQISQIVCGHCNYIHHNHEYFNSINLELPTQMPVIELISNSELSKKISKTLYDCLNEYTNSIILNNNKGNIIEWKCDKCNHKEKSEKIIKFWDLPPVLAINLKRFNVINNNLYKNNIEIIIPFELDCKKYILNKQSDIFKNKKYVLKSIGLHYGNIRGGHYVSVIRKSNKNINDWLIIDDENIMEIKKEDIPMKNAYMLFYNLE